LYKAVGSISANIAEGYSHRSDKDQARFCEYSLGSTREGRIWYQARHILSEPVATHSLKLLTKIARLLLTAPAERGYKLAEERAAYDISPEDLLDNPPVP